MEQKSLIRFKNKEIIKKVKKETFDYKTFSVTPSRFIESGKALEAILDTMTALYDPRIKYDYLTKSVIVNQPSPFYYEILYEGGNNKSVTFNYIIPDKYSDTLVNKLDKIFRVAAIKQREDYFNSFSNKFYCEFNQKKHFLFALNSDYRENGLLDNLMSIINNIQENDKILLQIGIVPLNENWKEKWSQANLKHKNGDELKVHTNFAEFAFDKLFNTTESLLDIFDMVMGVNKKEVDKYEKNTKQIDKWSNNSYHNSNMTIKKVNNNGYLGQLRVYCNQEYRMRYYAKLFSAAFKILDADQELEMGKIKLHKEKNRNFDIQFTKQIFSTREMSCFLRLPDRKMQVDFRDNMKSIEVTENMIPEELTKGSKIRIGTASFKGNKFMTYYPEDVAMRAMSKVYVGPSRAGKTEAIKQFIIDAIKNGDSVICIDTIKGCEITQDVRDYMPEEYKDKLVILDYSNIKHLLPLSFNEIADVQFDDKINQMMAASHLTGSLIGFINSIAGFNQEDQLTPRMKKFLSCAGKIVLSQPNTTIKDVLNTLIEADIRDKFIKSSGFPENNIMIQELRRLDDGKGGTNYSLISGIVDRVSVLLNDFATEMLISTPSNPEINFTKFADEGKCVLLKLSDEVFDREALKSLITFLYFKVWMAVGTARVKNPKPKLCHIIIDEIHQYPQILTFLSAKVKECAKFGLSFLVTSHLASDMRQLLPSLKAAGASFLLLGGTSKENLKLFELELLQGGVSLEEGLSTKRFDSLNIINFNREYCIYTSKLPGEVKTQYKKVDRSHLDLEFSEKYGTPFEW